MNLCSLQVLRVQGTVTGLAGAAAGQTHREGLLVRVGDSDGLLGHGEASPLPSYSQDTAADCARQLAAVDVTALPLPGQLPAVDWVERALATAEVSAPSARFALETALLDWLGQRRGLSLAALLSDPGAAIRRRRLAALVPDVATARAAHARGIRTFKLKVAAETFDDDMRLARSLRHEFGADIALRFDANGRLSTAAAPAQLQALAGLAAEFVEEPVALEEFRQMTASRVPLAADESLAVPGAWPALASVCRVVVLKPTLLGGLCACLRLARDAAARGLALTVTHTFDGPVALAAAAELATILPGRVLACGLDRHGALAAWPQWAIPQLAAADLTSADRPGLGLPEVGRV